MFKYYYLANVRCLLRKQISILKVCNNSTTSSSNVIASTDTAIKPLTQINDIAVNVPSDVDFQHKFSYFSYMKDPLKIETELNKVFLTFSNPYEFYYVFDKYHKEFTPNNLFRYFSTFSNYVSSTNQINTIKIPLNLIEMYDKQIIRNAKYFEDNDCRNLFVYLRNLNLSLDNYSVQSVMQLLKYHVNTLNITSICKIKQTLELLKQRDYVKTEFVENLIYTLEVALQYAFQLKQNEIGTLMKVNDAVFILKYYTNELSEKCYNDLLNLINLKWSSELNSFHVLHLIESLAKRNYKHITRLHAICKFIARHVNTFHVILKENYKSDAQFLANFYSYRFLMAFNKLEYYESATIDLLINDILDTFSEKNYSQFHNSQTHVNIVNAMLDTVLKFRHKNTSFIVYFINNCINESLKFNFHNFLYYCLLCKYDNLSVETFNKCYELTVSKDDLNNEIILRTIKALLWYDKDDMAQDLFKRFDLQDNVNMNDKLFLNYMLKANLNITDEERNKLMTRSRISFMNILTKITQMHKRWEYKEVSSYLSDFVVSDLKTDEKCHIVLIYDFNYLRNEPELDGEMELRKKYLKKMKGRNHLFLADLNTISSMKKTNKDEVAPYLKREIEYVFQDDM